MRRPKVSAGLARAVGCEPRGSLDPGKKTNRPRLLLPPARTRKRRKKNGSPRVSLLVLALGRRVAAHRGRSPSQLAGAARRRSSPGAFAVCSSVGPGVSPSLWLQHRRVRVPALSQSAIIARRVPVAAPRAMQLRRRRSPLLASRSRFEAFLEARCSFPPSRLQLFVAARCRPPTTSYPVEAFFKLVVAFVATGCSIFQHWLQL